MFVGSFILLYPLPHHGLELIDDRNREMTYCHFVFQQNFSESP